MQRRKLLKIGGRLAGLGALTGLYTWRVEPYWLEFVQQPLPIKNLPDELVGKSLMQISDIHVGNRVRQSFLVNSLQRAQGFEPDIVVYTGDYVSYDNEDQFTQVKAVFDHAVRGKLGTLGILGNHDYGHNWSQAEVAEKMLSILEGCGIQMLRNTSTQIAGLNILGLDDYWGLNFEPEALFKSVNPAAANLVLCHNPDACDEEVWHGYQGWILAGHTHGGQCKPPFLPPPILPVKNRRYTSGVIDLLDGRMLYINRALGHLRPVRFNVRPEITVFELQQA